MTIQGLDHLFYVLRSPMHILVSQEPTPFKHNRFVHLLILFELFELLFCLAELDIDFILLLLSCSQLAIDVCLEGIVSRVDLMLLLFIVLMVITLVLAHFFLQQICLFFIDFMQLSV